MEMDVSPSEEEEGRVVLHVPEVSGMGPLWLHPPSGGGPRNPHIGESRGGGRVEYVPPHRPCSDRGRSVH